MSLRSLHIVLVAGLTFTACAERSTPEQPDTRAADEAVIHAAVKAWSAAAEAKDAESFARVYAEDAVLMLEDAPDMRGMAAIREGIEGMMQDPNFDLSFEADNVVVARSGDLAYETGTYTLTMSDPEEKPATEKGHYVVVWHKQANGGWKVVLDAPVSDPPQETATE